jgi:DeoR family transcriptional regulator of aga operon
MQKRAEMSNHENLMKLERQGLIRKLVEEEGRASVPELSGQFDVSETTIRRDLEELEGMGWVRRTYGGAVRAERARKEPPMVQRISEQILEKQNIGRAAAALIEAGQTIFFGSGTTVLEVVKQLPRDIQLTAITNSLPVANHLADFPHIDLIVIGGMLRKNELSMVGHIAEQAVREFRSDMAILGMHAIDSHHGFTNDFLPETMTDRAILTIAPRVVIVADHTKFGKVSSVLVAPVTAAHTLITDQKAPRDCVQELIEHGIEVVQT